MKILQVINTLAMGGAEKLLSDIVPLLCQMGHEVDVLVFDRTETPFMQNLKKTGVRVMALGDGNRSPYSVVNLLKLAPIARKYDVVHSHTTPVQLFTVLSKIMGLSSAKLVTTEHSTNNHRRGKWQYKFIDRIMYSGYDHIICISEMSKENLEKQIGFHDNISVIENGIDVENFHTAESLDRKSLGLLKSDFLITMVGRFVDAKDQDTVIKALPMLSGECKLLFVGIGDRLKSCKELANTLNVADRTFFLGLRNDIPHLLQTSDVVVLSSHWEGFGLAAVEGMATHTPVVASDVPGLGEVVRGAGVLFREGDYNQLSEEIKKLKSDKVYYEQVADRCFERALKYTISETARYYNEVYMNLE